MVRKSEYLSLSDWNSPGSWKPNIDPFDLDLDDPRLRMPKEAYYTMKCHAASPDHFVKLRAWDTEDAEREIILYTDYCGFGDFTQFDRRDFLSARYLVSLFYELTRASVVMERGTLSGGETWDDEVVQ